MVIRETLQRNAIALLPTRPRKKLTVDILQAIEREISRYVLTITLINTALGMILAGALYWLGVELPEALLWGTLAALLNFAPYVRSEEHTSELQSLMRISYAVFCL